jgi:ATP-dependent Clp protease protease subunit
MSKLVFLMFFLMTILMPFSFTSAKDSSSDTVSLSSDNTIVINDEINGDTVADAISLARKLNSSHYLNKSKPLYVVLNTPGGSVEAGLELVEALNGLGRPVHTVTLFAASMGFQIAQNLGTRYIVKNGVLMSHRVAGSFEGSFGGAYPSQVDSRYHLWLQKTIELDQQTVKRTKGKQTLASYQKQYANEMWLTGSESVEQGYADQIVLIRCDKTLDGVTTHNITYMGLPVSYDLDNCPINTNPHNIKIKVDTNQGLIDYATFVKKGGHVGFDCLTTPNITRLCAVDPTLTADKVESIKGSFLNNYALIKNHVIPMRW